MGGQCWTCQTGSASRVQRQNSSAAKDGDPPGLGMWQAPRPECAGAGSTVAWDGEGMFQQRGSASEGLTEAYFPPVLVLPLCPGGLFSTVSFISLSLGGKKLTFMPVCIYSMFFPVISFHGCSPGQCCARARLQQRAIQFQLVRERGRDQRAVIKCMEFYHGEPSDTQEGHLSSTLET